MQPAQLNWIANFIWGIADDVLRDSTSGKNTRRHPPHDGTPATSTLSRTTKKAVVDMKGLFSTRLESPIKDLRPASGQRPGVLQHLEVHPSETCVSRASQQQLRSDFEAYSTGSHPCPRHPRKLRVSYPDSRFQRRMLSETLIEKFLSPDINLSRIPCSTGMDRSSIQASTIMRWERYSRSLSVDFNEENKRGGGEHWTPSDASS